MGNKYKIKQEIAVKVFQNIIIGHSTFKKDVFSDD